MVADDKSAGSLKPQGREQPLNAERVQALGAGVALPTDAPADAIARAVGAVLEEPGYERAARQVKALVDRHGRGEEATAHVASLLGAQAP